MFGTNGQRDFVTQDIFESGPHSRLQVLQINEQAKEATISLTMLPLFQL